MNSSITAIYEAILQFADSNFFVALITLLVGSLAIYIYKKQQSDTKKDAANILLLEIKNAESQLMQAKEIILRDKIVPESIFAMKTSSWSKYGYLFIRDLTDEEWRLINNFYEKCRQYDEVVEYSNTFFKNERGANTSQSSSSNSRLYKKYAQESRPGLRDTRRSRKR